MATPMPPIKCQYSLQERINHAKFMQREYLERARRKEADKQAKDRAYQDEMRRG